LGAILLPIYWQDDCQEYHDCQTFQHYADTVSRPTVQGVLNG
jgi:hypothetical protein